MENLFHEPMIYPLDLHSAETEYIKLHTKTQFFKNNIGLFIHFKDLLFSCPFVKVYKKVVKFSFTYLHNKKYFGF
jgi:hypothetical protein